MTPQEVIETRHAYYLHMQIVRMVQMPCLNEAQWHMLHYMQFCLLVILDEYPTIPQGL